MSNPAQNFRKRSTESLSHALDFPLPGAAEAAEGNDDRRRPRQWIEQPRVMVLWYTAAFIGSEAVGAFVGVEWQVLTTAVLLLLALNHALFGFRNARTAAVVMSALFTSRLIVLTLPITDASLATRTGLLAVFAILISRLAIWVMGHDVGETRRAEGFPLQKPIVSESVTTYLVVASGVPIGFLAYKLLDSDPLQVLGIFGSLTAAWVIVVLCLALGALGEELLYRQLVAAMVQHTGNSQTPIFSGLLFGAIYLGVGNLAFTALAFVTGVWFAWSCERTGSIRGPVLSHIIISVMVFVILPSAGVAS